MIEMTFTANSVPELRAIMIEFIMQGARPVDTEPETAPEPPASKKAAPKVSPAKPAPKQTATPSTEPEPEPLEEMFAEEEAKTDAKSLLETKTKTITVLQQAFADGKVLKLRKLLDAFGNGAKSFPEIPAEQFGKIADAIQKGALNDA